MKWYDWIANHFKLNNNTVLNYARSYENKKAELLKLNDKENSMCNNIVLSRVMKEEIRPCINIFHISIVN